MTLPAMAPVPPPGAVVRAGNALVDIVALAAVVLVVPVAILAIGLPIAVVVRLLLALVALL